LSRTVIVIILKYFAIVDMNRNLTILFAPLDAVGHVSACIGIAEVLRDRGHKIVFVVSDSWREKLNIYGFEEEIIEQELKNEITIEDPAKYWAELCEKSGLFSSLPPLEKMKNTNKYFLRDIVENARNSDPTIKKIIDRIKPDVIIVDGFVWLPSLMSSGIPWVWSISTNPLCMDYSMDDERLPPSLLG